MVLAQLRAATAQAHAALEAAVDMPSVAKDRGRFLQLIKDFYGFHTPVEEALLNIPGWGAQPHQPAERRKEPWLEADLQSLGLTQEEIARLPQCAELPPHADLASAYGCAYVLEGSTLGGRHILHLFAEGESATWPRRFFTGYGAETGTRWRQFCEALEQAATKLPEAPLLAAAEETFAKLGKWLARRHKVG